MGSDEQLKVVQRICNQADEGEAVKILASYVQERVDAVVNEIAEKLYRIANGYSASGHTHRAQMLNAIAKEIIVANRAKREKAASGQGESQ